MHLDRIEMVGAVNPEAAAIRSKPEAAAVSDPFVRVKARLIDTGACAAVIAFLGGVIALTVAVAGALGTPGYPALSIVPFDPTPNFAYHFEEFMATVGLLLWVVSLTVFFYEVPMVALRGQTLGKKIMGIRVVRIDDCQSPGWIKSLVRCAMLLIPTIMIAGVLVNTGIFTSFFMWMLSMISRSLSRILWFYDHSSVEMGGVYIAVCILVFMLCSFLFYRLLLFCGLSRLKPRRGLHDRTAGTALIEA